MTVAVGLVGFGLAGSAFHAPLVEAEPRMRLAAVASARPDAVRERFPEAAVVAHADALLADPAIDLVVVATPNELHAPLAGGALEAGKHVVVDKPLVADPADGPALLALAREKGRVLTAFHNRRWDGDFLTVRRLVEDGRLGRIALAEFCWDRFRPAIKRGWREEPGSGAGLLADLGPHLVDQALLLFGPPDAVTGDLGAQRDGAVVDDRFAVTLHYGDRRVLLCASTLVADPRPRFALYGTAGSFVKYGIDPQEAHLRAGGSVGHPRFGEDADDLRGRLAIGDGAPERLATERGDWRRFYAGVAAAILDGAAPPVDPADALAGLRLIELARRSAAERRTLDLSPAPPAGGGAG